MRYLFLPLFLIVACCLGGCEKKEQAVTLPQRSSTATQAQVSMGEDYDTQLFYNLADSAVVSTSDHACWDVSFETAPGQNHFFMNGGLSMELISTQDTDFAARTTLPAGTKSNDWQYDDASGIPDSSAAGNWQQNGDSSSRIFIIRTGSASPYSYEKLRIVSVNAQQYIIEYGPLAATQPTCVTLHKDVSFNFIYFKFSSGLIAPEPPKAQWDILFTRYQCGVYDDQIKTDIPYLVNGVLLNPYQTTAAVDSTDAFNTIDVNTAAKFTFSTNRDVIGYDWKTYSSIGATGGTYSVNTAKCYLIRTQSGQLWKLHFTGFYNSMGQKGSPSFEFQRLQ